MIQLIFLFFNQRLQLIVKTLCPQMKINPAVQTNLKITKFVNLKLPFEYQKSLIIKYHSHDKSEADTCTLLSNLPKIF